MPEEDRLAVAWPVACGSAMAGHGEIVGFQDGIVQVLVSDKTWLHQMESMREVMVRELGKIAGVAVSGIHFQVKGLREKNSRVRSKGRV
jgi:hypothetical protein